MKDEQLERLIGALTVQKKNGDILDVVSKVGIALCVAGILWVASQITALDKNLAVVVQSQATMKDDVLVLKSFASQPRFTKEDYVRAEAPQDDKINQIVKELDMRRDWMGNVNDEIGELKRDLGYVKRDLEDLHKE